MDKLSSLPLAQPNRRQTLRLGLLGTGALGFLSACGGVKSGSESGGTGNLKIGYVSPQTGALAPFGEADSFVIDAVRSKFGAGIPAGGGTTNVDILVKDSQSDVSRAAAVARDLILQDNVDLMLVASTPETTNPVADQCEANGVPCISTVAPWQSYFFGRNGTADSPFKWTYHFFWGLEDIESVYADMWSQVSTNKQIGALWPNDSDGVAFAAADTGFPATIAAGGYTLTDPGRYPNNTQDFTAQISRFKAAGAEILTGVPIPPDFATFYRQAAQQGYRPKVATVAKSLLFPSTVEALGELGDRLGTEVWWTPTHPFTSSLTGQSAQELADAFTTATGKQWTQPIGFVHALFEVAAAALAAADEPRDREALAAAIGKLRVDTIVGGLDWAAGPVANVTKTPLVGGQWRQSSGDRPYVLVVVSNSDHPEIPKAGSVEAIG